MFSIFGHLSAHLHKSKTNPQTHHNQFFIIWGFGGQAGKLERAWISNPVLQINQNMQNISHKIVHDYIY